MEFLLNREGTSTDDRILRVLKHDVSPPSGVLTTVAVTKAGVEKPMRSERVSEQLEQEFLPGGPSLYSSYYE